MMKFRRLYWHADCPICGHYNWTDNKCGKASFKPGQKENSNHCQYFLKMESAARAHRLAGE